MKIVESRLANEHSNVLQEVLFLGEWREKGVFQGLEMMHG